MTEPASVVWVIVLNWNGWEDTLRCLASLRDQDYPAMRVMVVDNGSTDGSIERLRRANPDLEVLALPDNLGFAGGMNRGMAAALAAGAEFVLLLNNDAELAPDAVRLLVEAAGRHPQVAMAVPTIRHRDVPDSYWYAGGSLSPWTGTVRHWDRPSGSEPRPVSFGTGCCLLVSRDTYQAIGGLNEEYFLYFEDVEWSDRVRAAGRVVLYVPTATAWHEGGASTASQHTKAPALDYYDMRNGLAFVVRRLHGLHRVSALAFLFLVRIPRKVVRIMARSPRRREALRALVDGVRDGLQGRMGQYGAGTR